MILLKYLGEEPMEFRLTKCPVSNPRACPAPEGVRLSDIDKNDPEYKMKREKILNHPNYSTNEPVVLKPGVNKFENEEHAEYLYMILGNPETGGVINYADGSSDRIKNDNILIEVDEKEKEIRDNLFKKHRMPLKNAHIAQ
jgi:hypothetical protein